MTTNVVKISEQRKVSRPLKVLIPLIQGELQQGNSAGHEHYRRAGEMLIEAKELIPYGGWNRWLTKNFDLSRSTAGIYMRWARTHLEIGGPQVPYASMRDMRGGTERQREDRQSTQQQAFKRVLRDVARDTFVQERQARDDENQIHRDLADELIDIGYRALATKLHPDRGGERIAMARLNAVRAALKSFAQTKRFI